MHPYKQLVLHIDFQRVEANTKLHMKRAFALQRPGKLACREDRRLLDQPRHH